jgi:hypothetical protein
MKPKFWYILLLVVSSIAANAQAGPEGCAAALTQTGRNELLQISQRDRRAYFWHQVCSANATDVEGNFQKAAITLGLSYKSSSEYCEAERSEFASYDFDYTRASTVVEKALDSWLACIRLWRNGILLTPRVAPESLVLTLERGSKGVGQVNRVIADAGTICTAVIGSTEKRLSGVINYVLPNDKTWNINCVRKAVPSSTMVGATVLPATTVTLDTSEGAFSLTLDAAPRGPESWATNIDQQIRNLAQRINDVDTFSHSRAPMKLGRSSCENVQWGDCTVGGWADCPEGKYLAGVYNAGGTNSCVRWLRCCSPEPTQ